MIVESSFKLSILCPIVEHTFVSAYEFYLTNKAFDWAFTGQGGSYPYCSSYIGW